MLRHPTSPASESANLLLLLSFPLLSILPARHLLNISVFNVLALGSLSRTLSGCSRPRMEVLPYSHRTPERSMNFWRLGVRLNISLISMDLEHLFDHLVMHANGLIFQFVSRSNQFVEPPSISTAAGRRYSLAVLGVRTPSIVRHRALETGGPTNIYITRKEGIAGLWGCIHPR